MTSTEGALSIASAELAQSTPRIFPKFFSSQSVNARDDHDKKQNSCLEQEFFVISIQHVLK